MEKDFVTLLFELTEYFSEFHDEKIIIPVFGDSEEPKLFGDICLINSPTTSEKYDEVLFEKFYQKKLKAKGWPDSKSKCEFILSGFKERFETPLLNRQEYVIIENWNDFLSERDIPTKKAPPTKENSELEDSEISIKINDLKKIWLAEPKLSVEGFIQKGVSKNIWNNDLKITVNKKSAYGTGKTLLAGIFIAFKGWAISENLDYNEAGRIFCKVFNIETKETTKEKYKAFSSGNPKIIKEIKRNFNVK